MLVSIIIPCFNREEMILETLNSVYAQTYRPLELVVVDDGSTDNSIEVVKKFSRQNISDTSFKVKIYQQKNNGAPSARNFGLRHCTGDFIQFLDSDDILCSNKIKKQLEFLTSFPDCDFVYCQSMIFNHSIGDTDEIVGNEKSKTLKGHIGANALKTDLGLYRVNTITKMGFWNENLKVWQEREYNLRLFTNKLNIGYIPEVLAYYRVHSNERISKTLTEQRHLDSLKVLERTAINGLSSDDLKVAYTEICSHYFSIYKHALASNKKNIAKSAAYNSLVISLKSLNFKKILKSMAINISMYIFPIKVSHSLIKRFL
ncbi:MULTISPECIES: glycosyltransferase family 2 protein [unclassified Cobetia]|uniref:glycosyltransferase family 2 protein n=1 Tax=unclassified Cobetia TaxID=2609414 RepID=UPI00178C8528|nr:MULTISPECIES: glycosyltransferase family 2 protein [unclassified Cobetia]MBE2170226.1 glycosyltransferase family 2 protein [Cobetia sp. 2AS1]MDH2446991.1 glycosyltransferase family 2 protein [Cobetia sp. 2AS]